MEVKKMLSSEEVRLIYKDTYNFYLKWKDISSPDDWDALMKDMHEIDQRYNCDLCRQILIELVKVIQDEFKRRDTDVNKEPG
jgi:hypothetical protein